MSIRNNKPAIARRREEARERDAERATRSAEEQIKALDFRLGRGVGAKRERARLKAFV